MAKRESLEDKLKRQEWELRTLWLRQWYRIAPKMPAEWRAQNPHAPHPQAVVWNSPLPDGSTLDIDWDEFNRKFGLK